MTRATTIHDHKVLCDDLWRYEDGPDDDWDDEPESPEQLADPSCVECGGMGGWMAYVGGVEEVAWVMCPCTEDDGDDESDE